MTTNPYSDTTVGFAYIREVDGAKSTLANVGGDKVTLGMYNGWLAEFRDYGAFQVGNSLFVPAHMDFAPAPPAPPVTTS